MSYLTYLNKDQIEELQEAFRMFDRNGDGNISPQELRLALISLGHDITESELYDLIGTVGVHRSATLSLPKFMEMIGPRMAAVESDESLAKTFQLFDRDDDGYLTSQDVRAFMVMMGVVVPDSDIMDICREVDMDHDGRVSLSDFMNFMHSPL